MLGKRAYLPCWIVFLGVIAAFVFVEQQNQTIRLQTVRADVQHEAGLLRSQLEGYLNADIQLVKGLVAIISVNPSLSQEKFSEVASHVIGEREEFINVAVAPDSVVQMVYPFEANKLIIGLDFTQNDSYRAAVIRARDSGQMVLAGPVELIHGGQGFIARFPIFIDETGEKKFWGIASAVLDAEKI
mgnify:CR=1 FL=1